MGRPSHVPVRYHHSKVGHVYDNRNPGYLTQVETNRRQARALVLQAAFPTFAEALGRMGGDHREKLKVESRKLKSEDGGGAKIRNPRSEIRRKSEVRNPKTERGVALSSLLAGVRSAWPWLKGDLAVGHRGEPLGQARSTDGQR